MRQIFDAVVLKWTVPPGSEKRQLREQMKLSILSGLVPLGSAGITVTDHWREADRRLKHCDRGGVQLCQIMIYVNRSQSNVSLWTTEFRHARVQYSVHTGICISVTIHIHGSA